MCELTIQNDGSLFTDEGDRVAAPDRHRADATEGVVRQEATAAEHDSIRSKPLIELLKIAEVMGVISGWSISGPSLVLRRGQGNILVRAVDAGDLLVRLMSEDRSQKSD